MNALKFIRPIGRHWVLKGTQKQLDRMEYLWDREQYWEPEFQKYFLVVNPGNNTGLYFLPKKRYFKAYDKNEDWEKMFETVTGVKYIDYLLP